MRRLLLLLSFGIASSLSFGQSDVWSTLSTAALSGLESDQILKEGATSSLFELDLEALKQFLKKAPSEYDGDVRNSNKILDLPLPDGRWMNFRVYHAPVFKEELAAKYPDIKSYGGFGMEPGYSVHFDYSPQGFKALIRTPRGWVLIDPYHQSNTDIYRSYYPADFLLNDFPLAATATSCGWSAETMIDPVNDQGGANYFPVLREEKSTEVQLRVYDMALACTGEFAQIHGGTTSSVLAAFNTAVNRVNEIVQVEVAVKFEIIDASELVIFLNPDSDPYVNSNNGGELLSQNPDVLDQFIPPVLYDIGHVFTGGCTDVGGIASGVACSSGKARGVTCHFSSNVAFIAENIMAHELAHQFTAGHTFSNCPGNMGQLASASAFEPGSGSTIMSYSGVCDNQDIGASDLYYHVGNLDEMMNFSRVTVGATCPDLVPSGNTEPTIEIPLEDGFYIPISTPFKLTGIGFDEDGDNLDYCWEQYDLGPVSELGNPEGDAPAFRSYPPNPDPTRFFPSLPLILANQSSSREVLPTYSRNLTFRCTVRDNDPLAGGTIWDEIAFQSTEQAGPFLVEYPNTSNDDLTGGDYIEITWDVANTDNDLVDCQRVNILLSEDGGNTFEYVLANSVPNVGSAMVFVPNISTSAARIMIEAANNIFFDVSNSNFSISPTSEPTYALTIEDPASQFVCTPAQVAVDFAFTGLNGYSESVTLEILGGVPNDATATLTSTILSPGEGSTLQVDLLENDDFSEEEIMIQAIIGGTDTLNLSVYLELYNNEFPDLTLLSPDNGLSDQPLGVEFDWTDVSNADYYDFQIATTPDFTTSLVEEGTILLESEYALNAVLDENDLYFWRIRPTNVCGTSDWLFPSAFHTLNVQCNEFESTAVPLGIPAAGTPTVSSEITMVETGVINDLNVTNLAGFHDGLKDIEVRLEGPSGTEVVLFSGICGNIAPFNLGLDDESPFPIDCPVNNGQPFQPEEPLSAFDDQSITGIWTLEVEVIDNSGNGGFVDSWGLEFCASFQPKTPILINNDTLLVQPGALQYIFPAELLVEDEDNEPMELEYTVVQAPENGTLIWFGNELEPGGRFRQASIDALNVTYTHNGGPEIYDSFYFVVQDGTGGWIGITKFNIKIDPSAPVATQEVVNEEPTFQLTPNPSTGQVLVQFTQPQERGQLSVLDMQGRTLRSLALDRLQEQELNLQDLPTGLYLVRWQTEQGQWIQKLVLE
ncbi:MAG: reprolysin-like metallopeptidase [Bacteroidota bacterium]